ncbi:MAG: NAD-dependent epimerase/dehydratase family protein [Nitrososphaerota archaeon]|nr:NAD-dependent epimerase/dehydratase family protein [Nitrososphaerota archaeon]
MRCLVTGCAGFIGSTLSEALISDGHSVIGVDCFTDYYAKSLKLANLRGIRRSKGFKFIEADLASAKLSPVVTGVDAVFHLAAQPGVRASWGASFTRYINDNILATQRLLEALKGRKLEKLVYASSSSIYGDAEVLPTPEDVTPRPVSPYGATKLAGEHLCNVYFRNYGLPAVSLRYFTVYGPRQRPDMAFNRFISRISAGREIEIFGDGTQRRDFTFVGDVVAGTMLALRAKPGSTYNVGAGRTVTLNEAIAIAESLIGKKAKVRRRETATGDVRSTSADISRIRDELGYSAQTPLEDGLNAQVSYQLGRKP